MQTPSEQPHLVDYLQVVLKRKWIFIACFLATVGTVIVSDYLAEPIYQAKATIDINRDSSGSVLKGQPIDLGGIASEDFFLNSHYQMMTSRPVLLKVVEALHLDQVRQEEQESGQESKINSPNGILQRINPFNFFFKESREGQKLAQDPEEKSIASANALKNMITIKPVQETHLVKILVEDSDPSLAMKIANTLSETYIEYDFQSNLESTQKTFELLSAQLHKMRKEIAESQASIFAILENKKISPSEGQKVQTRNMDELNTSYMKAQTDKMAIEARIKELRRVEKAGDFGESIPTIAESGILQSLTKDLIEAQIQLSQLKEVTKTKHPLLEPPEIAATKTRMTLIKKEIQKEISRAIDNLSVEEAILENRERTLAAAIQEGEKKLLRASKLESQFIPLEKEVTAEKDLYDLLVVKLKEANIGQAMRQTSIRIIEPALLPKSPIKPRKTLNLILGILVGLVLGGGSTFFLEYIDRTIRTPEQVEKYLALPLLCTVPKLPIKGRI